MSWRTDEYYAAEIEEAQTMAVHLHAKEQLAQFTMVRSKYEKDLERQQKRNTLSDADQVIVVSGLEDIVEERTHLQAAVP
jgi:preprotein translocase subunit YajC